MKKALVVVFISISFLLIIFKLKSEKLKCEYKVDYDDINIVNSIEFNFKSNTYKQIDKMIFKNEEVAKQYFKDIEDYIDEYNLRLEGKSIISEIDESMDKNAKKKDLKKKYESYGYACK